MWALQTLVRLVQAVLQLVKVVYWQLFVLAHAFGVMGGPGRAPPMLNKVPARVALCVESDSGREKRAAKGNRAVQKQRELLVRKSAVVTTWCFDAGVDDVTIFENEGVLSESLEFFCKQLKQEISHQPILHKRIFRKLGRIRAINIFEHGRDTPSATVTINESVEEATENVSVRFLCSEDSDKDIVRLAQQLVDENDIRPENINESLLSGRLSASKGNRSKLELILAYSLAPNLLGFPPWLMRTPEILHIGESLINASYASFVWAMYKYSKTEQRWGR